jgi:hypothetical protein
MQISRRDFMITSAVGLAVAFRPPLVFGQSGQAPLTNPTASLRIAWTGKLPWDRVQDVSALPGAGEFWDERLEVAQEIAEKQGGGVVFFPPGVYRFKENIRLRNGVILRGADPEGSLSAQDERFAPASRLEFPRYLPIFTGDGTPVSSAFKGILLADPAQAAHCGVVHLDLNRGHIQFGEGENRRCGANRLVFGCVLRNAAGVMAEIPNAKENHPGWLRYTHKFRSAIRVHASENALVANNRIPKSGDDNFTIEGYPLKERNGVIVPFDVEFDFDNRPGIYVNQHCIGGAGGSADSGTPETHPWGFRKGSVIRDNYIYNAGRCAIGFSGDGVICARNVIRFARDAFRPTVTGVHRSYGSATNDNRAIEMRGWRWVLEENDYVVHKNFCSDRRYYINDGEGLMHENHCNSSIVDSRLINNRGNSYLSLYHVGAIDGLHIEGNDISTPGRISDIYVTAPRHKAEGDFPIRRVTIVNNTTRSNGIRVMGWPAEKVVIKDNRHAGATPGVILNEAQAELANNTHYEVKVVERS